MRQTLSPQTVLITLQESRFNDLLGVTESDTVDFKDQPYLLEKEKGKYALVDDVVSFANASGGIIVIGYRADKDFSVEGECTSEVTFVLADMIREESYRSICSSFIYPPLTDLQFAFFPAPNDPSRGIFAILIPPAKPEEKPHLLTHIVDHDSEKKQTTRYSLSTRGGPRNNPFSVQRVHALLQAGTSLYRVENAIASISERLTSLDARFSGQIEASEAEGLAAFTSSLGELLKDADLEERPMLVLGAFPSRSLKVDAIFDSESNLVAAFDNIPKLRPDGFGFVISDRSKLTSTKCRRKMIAGYKAVQLSESGMLIIAVPADEDLLAWFQRRNPDEPLRYRSFILAELTTTFALYAKTIMDEIRKLEAFESFYIAAGLNNSFVDGLPPLLGISRDDGQYHRDWVQPKAAQRPSFICKRKETLSATVDKLAFDTRALIYREFGFSDDDIPYQSSADSGRVTRRSDVITAKLE